MCAVWKKDIMDSVGHEAITSSHQFSQKGGWKGDRKGNGKGTQKGASSKEEKVETKGKAKVKERKDNVSTKAQKLQKNSGKADPGNCGQNNLGKTDADTASWWEDDWYTAGSGSQASAAAEEISTCFLR